MPIPADSKYPKLRFSCHGVELCIALFDFDPVACPGTIYASLLKLEGTQWREIDKRDPIWDDQKEQIDPEFMAKLIVDDFNNTIATLSGGGELTYEQKLGAAIANGYKVVDNKLVKI